MRLDHGQPRSGFRHLQLSNNQIRLSPPQAIHAATERIASQLFQTKLVNVQPCPPVNLPFFQLAEAPSVPSPLRATTITAACPSPQTVFDNDRLNINLRRSGGQQTSRPALGNGDMGKFPIAAGAGSERQSPCGTNSILAPESRTDTTCSLPQATEQSSVQSLSDSAEGATKAKPTMRGVNGNGKIAIESRRPNATGAAEGTRHREVPNTPEGPGEGVVADRQSNQDSSGASLLPYMDDGDGMLHEHVTAVGNASVTDPTTMPLKGDRKESQPSPPPSISRKVYDDHPQIQKQVFAPSDMDISRSSTMGTRHERPAKATPTAETTGEGAVQPVTSADAHVSASITVIDHEAGNKKIDIVNAGSTPRKTHTPSLPKITSVGGAGVGITRTVDRAGASNGCDGLDNKGDTEDPEYAEDLKLLDNKDDMNRCGDMLGLGFRNPTRPSAENQCDSSSSLSADESDACEKPTEPRGKMQGVAAYKYGAHLERGSAFDNIKVELDRGLDAESCDRCYDWHDLSGLGCETKALGSRCSRASPLFSLGLAVFCRSIPRMPPNKGQLITAMGLCIALGPVSNLVGII